MLKLKLQYFGHLMWRTDSLVGPWWWERLKAGGEGWNGWMISLSQRTWVWAGSGSWWWTGRPGGLQSMGLQRVRHDWATELNWTDVYLKHFQTYTVFEVKYIGIGFPKASSPWVPTFWVNHQCLSLPLFDLKYTLDGTSQKTAESCL